MTRQTVTILALAIALSACAKNEGPAGSTQEDASKQAGEPAPAPVAQALTNGDDWALTFTMNEVDPRHKKPLHVVEGGTLAIVSAGNGEYTIRTGDSQTEKWPAGWSEAVLVWHDGKDYCPPLPPSEDAAALDSTDVHARAAAEINAYKRLVAFEAHMAKDTTRKFVSKNKVKLHDANGESEHYIWICPVDPEQTDDGEVLVKALTGGGTHDGISHGDS